MGFEEFMGSVFNTGLQVLATPFNFGRDIISMPFGLANNVVGTVGGVAKNTINNVGAVANNTVSTVGGTVGGQGNNVKDLGSNLNLLSGLTYLVTSYLQLNSFKHSCISSLCLKAWVKPVIS